MLNYNTAFTPHSDVPIGYLTNATSLCNYSEVDQQTSEILNQLKYKKLSMSHYYNLMECASEPEGL